MLAFNMKFLIAFIFCVIFGIHAADAQTFKDMIDKAVSECKPEVGATQDDIDRYINHIPETSASGKCLVACINQKFNVQDKDGKLDIPAAREAVKLLKLVSDDAFDKLTYIAEICLKLVKNEEDKCEVAFNWHSCLMNESKLAGYPPFLADL